MKAILPFLLSIPICCFSQNVAINDNGAIGNTNAILDVGISTNNQGILFPRITTVQRLAIAGLGMADEGLQVYDETTNSFWYWDGTQWVQISYGNDEQQLLGNAGTNLATNFVGTTDAIDLAFRTSYAERLRITSGGNVAIGTTTPAYNLHLIGNAGIEGDFVNQKLTGVHANAVQNIPFTNGGFNPINGSSTSIAITD